MSLRARLLAVICLALLLSFATATGLAAWRDVRLVRTEVSAALETAQKDATFAVASLGRQGPARAILDRFVASFDDSRHVRVLLLDDRGRVSAQSSPAVLKTVPPQWFLDTIAPRLDTVRVDLPGGSGFSALLLAPNPASEIGERWSETRDSVGLLALLSLLACALCWATLTQGLRPLGALARGLGQLGMGERAPRLRQAGPPEIAILAASFNRMAAALGSAEEQNSRLQNQLLRVAEEERADIARNLHDEVGPLLFAITTYVAAIEPSAEAGRAHEVSVQLAAVRETVAMLQGAVRDMLHRLRDVEADAGAATNLPIALERLLDFWRPLQPQTRFELVVDLDAHGSTEAQHAALLRVAQEAVSNAVRHGTPGLVLVELTQSDQNIVLRVSDDGAGGVENPGYGLPGMRERMAALGGMLEVRRDRGWTLTASAPLA